MENEVERAAPGVDHPVASLVPLLCLLQAVLAVALLLWSPPRLLYLYDQGTALHQDAARFNQGLDTAIADLKSFLQNPVKAIPMWLIVITLGMILLFMFFGLLLAALAIPLLYLLKIPALLALAFSSILPGLSLALGLLTPLVGALMILGAVDLFRLSPWAWWGAFWVALAALGVGLVCLALKAPLAGVPLALYALVALGVLRHPAVRALYRPAPRSVEPEIPAEEG